ncbi:MAG: TRAM domain-containing protein [Acidimicrobiia bacterium]|nr:TRAM domain-containing protein [Acidimicrobiia bacterium]
MIVEAIRLLVTLATTAVGYQIGTSWTPAEVGSDVGSITGSLVGAGVGYVLGGVLGRWIRRGLERAPQALDRATGPQLFAGAFGLMVGVVVGMVIAIPSVVLLPSLAGWPIGALAVLVMAAFGARVFSARAHDLLSAAGLRQRDPLRRTDVAVDGEPGYLIDSSAAIDGRVLELARAGLLTGTVLVAGFVVDELQAIADAADKRRRRAGRRGLDILDALRDVPRIEFTVLEDSVPEHHEVDAKLLALTARLDGSLVTTDHNLAQAASLRGITVLNPHALGESLRPVVGQGDEMKITIEKEGSEVGQGVGFLDDGTMVVVSDASGHVGDTVAVEVVNSLRTSVGRLLFAKLAT